MNEMFVKWREMPISQNSLCDAVCGEIQVSNKGLDPKHAHIKLWVREQLPKRVNWKG